MGRMGKAMGRMDNASPVESLEAPAGFEPANGGFANLCLTTWPRRPKAQSLAPREADVQRLEASQSGPVPPQLRALRALPFFGFVDALRRGAGSASGSAEGRLKPSRRQACGLNP